MFPAQTSLIPVQVALTRFWEEGGNVLADYPYWYLGTTPYRYLTGPILPRVLVGLHRLLPQFSLFEIIFGLIAACWLIGAGGVYLLVKELGRGKKKKAVAFLAAFFYGFGWLMPFFFRFADGLDLISFSFLPYALLFYRRFLARFSLSRAVSLGLVLTFLMLLNLAVFPSLFLGLVVLFLVQGDWEKAEEKLKQTFSVFGVSFLAVTWWYTPGYWLVSLTGPSLAGQGRLAVIFQLAKVVPTALALGAAVFSVKFFPKRKLLRDFGFYWLFTFGFLTLIRFLSDFDFWLDWSSYYLELQLGLGIVLGMIVCQKLKIKDQAAESKIKGFFVLAFVSVFYFLSFAFLFNRYVLGTFQREIEGAVEYRLGRKLEEEMGPGEKVLLSGTTAFWLNAFFDLDQVRGGVDQASVHSAWRKGVWEIREGTEPEDSLRWLRDLNVTWLVVHTSESEEYYHDFNYPEKFENLDSLKKISDEEGNRIYQILD